MRDSLSFNFELEVRRDRTGSTGRPGPQQEERPRIIFPFKPRAIDVTVQRSRYKTTGI
jgi:hypothetical protein